MITIRASQLNIDELLMLRRIIDRSLGELTSSDECWRITNCKNCNLKKLCNNLSLNRSYLDKQIKLRWSSDHLPKEMDKSK